MARYIDAEALVTRIIEDVITTTEEAEGNKDFFIDLINNPRFIPTADVAPKTEVAREIFAEIENTINNELQNNNKVLPQVEFSNEIWNRISGRINALQGIRDFIAELKKKYTEAPNA